MQKGSMGRKVDEPRSFSDCNDGRVVTGWQNVVGSFAGAVKSKDEPIQGCAKGCFFISALKAVAFKANGTLMKNATNFTFLNTTTMAEENQVLNDVKVAIDTTTSKPVYARCKNVNYHWPLLYEKAYALWLDSKNTQRHWDPVDPTQPDIKTIFQNGGNGVTAMMHISRYRNFVEKQNIAGAFNGTIPSYPMIAATRAIDPANLRLPDQLTAKHTYMISRKDALYFYLVDPCSNTEKRLTISKLSTNYFDTWGYVKP